MIEGPVMEQFYYILETFPILWLYQQSIKYFAIYKEKIIKVLAYSTRCPVTLELFRPFASGVLTLSNPTYALETTNASIGNKHFFTKKWPRQAYQKAAVKTRPIKFSQNVRSCRKKAFYVTSVDKAIHQKKKSNVINTIFMNTFHRIIRHYMCEHCSKGFVTQLY